MNKEYSNHVISVIVTAMVDNQVGLLDIFLGKW